MIYGSLGISNNFSVTVIERENCLSVHELKSKWCPQLGMAETRNVTQLMEWKVINAMNTSIDHPFKTGYLLNCLIIISTEILCHNVSVSKDSAMLYKDPSLKKTKKGWKRSWKWRLKFLTAAAWCMHLKESVLLPVAFLKGCGSWWMTEMLMLKYQIFITSIPKSSLY